MKDPREYDRDYLQWKEDLGGSWPVAYGVVCSQLNAKDAENAALRDALEELMAWQNGPPLETYRERWTKAMDNAQLLLGAAQRRGGE